MENLFNRFRNFTTLVLVLFAQLVLLAYQVKSNKDVPFLRFWTVTAVMPIATVVEDIRSGVMGFFENYFTLRDVRSDNKKMRDEVGRLKLENQSLKADLATAERAKALSTFTAQSPSKMLAARIVATGMGPTNKVVFVDRGSNAGVQKGMGVVTPDGIVGMVMAAFPTFAQVLLATDPGFAAGVVSQKNHVRGVLKGLNYGRCRVDYVENEQKVEMGEEFFTSGDDRVFPKGLPVGRVTAVRDGASGKEIFVSPTALEESPEDVLVILEGVMQAVPEYQAPAKSVYLGPDPSPNAEQTPGPSGPLETTADKVIEKYREIGEQQGHKFGLNPAGSRPIDYNVKLNPNAPKVAPGARADLSGKPEAAPGEVLESDVTEAPVTPPPAPANPTANAPANPAANPAQTPAKPPANPPARPPANSGAPPAGSPKPPASAPQPR